MKRVLSFLVLVMMLFLVACNEELPENSAATEAPASTAESGAPVEEDTEEKEMAKLTISGVVGTPTSDMIAHTDMFKELYPDVEVEFITCDANTREGVLKTPISAGDPPTIGFYWATRLNAFSDIGMCMDLNDVFEPEFFEKISPAMQDTVTGENGENWGVAFTAVYHTTFYNKDLFDEYGFEIPETWDDFTEIFARLKEDGIFGFATNSAAMQDCLYTMAFAELETKVGPGTAKAVADGTVSVAPGTPAGEAIRGVIEQVQEWYDAGYWYPGEGGINCTADDANAAFAQGRCMFIFNFSGAFATHEASCDFEVGTFLKPTSEAGMDKYEHIEPSVYFIPSNVTEAQLNTAKAFLEIVMSQEGQQAVIDSNNLPVVSSYEYEDISPALQQMIDTLDVPTNHFDAYNPTRTSSECQTFIKTQIFAGPLSGTMTIDDVLNEYERIRLAALEAQEAQGD